jgi:hypothetical protein
MKGWQMAVSDEKLKDRIRKLLNVAKQGSGATEGEIENALRFARLEMEKHHLEAVDIDDHCTADEIRMRAARMRPEDLEYGTAEFVCQRASLSTWESTLAAAIAVLAGSVEWYYESGIAYGTERRAMVTFYGPIEDVEICTELMAEWSVTIAGMGRLRWGGCFRGEGRSYCEGFAAALYKQADPRECPEPMLDHQSNERALTLVEAATQLAERKRHYATEWLRDVKGIRLSSRGSSQSGQHFADAYRQGRTDGNRAEFSLSRRPKLPR